MPSTVLAVDDSVTMRRVLEITFAGSDFNVITVESADAALQKLKAIKPDVVVTDVTLDPKNGYDLCEAAAPAAAAPRTANPLAAPLLGTQATPQANRPQPAAATTQVATPQARGQQHAQTLVYNPGVAMPAIPGTPPPGAARPLAQTGRTEAARPAAPTPAAGTPLGGAPARVQTLQAGGGTAPSLQAASASAQAHGPGDGATAQITAQMAGKREELRLTPAQVVADVAL